MDRNELNNISENNQEIFLKELEKMIEKMMGESPLIILKEMKGVLKELEENADDVLLCWVQSFAILNRIKPYVGKCEQEVVDYYNDMVIRTLDKIELYLTVGNGLAK